MKKKPTLRIARPATGPVTISACMMVKDESKNLHRCLRSIQNLVDEIIVVDTGSTDDSVAICKSYGAKIYYHPFDTPIIDDFSKYRNLSIGYAKSDWILIIDADEELCIEIPTAGLKKSLAAIPPTFNGASLPIKDIQGGNIVLNFNSTRLFRKGTVHYRDIIHNKPMLDGNQAKVITDAHIRHYGYDLTPEEKIKKRERTTSLLLKRIEINPDDYLAYFYLAQQSADNKDFEKAVQYGEEYIKRLDIAIRDGEHMESIYYCILHCYMALNDAEKANKWLQQGIKELPNDLDLAMALTEYGIWQRRSDLVVLGAKRFMELYGRFEKDPTLKGNRFIFSCVPEALGFCQFHFLVIYLHELVNIFGSIRANIEKTNPSFRTGVSNDLSNLLDRLGIPELKAKLIPEQKIKTFASLSDVGLRISRN